MITPLRYDMTDPEKPNPITSTDEDDSAYIKKTEDGKKQSVELYLKELGYKQVPLSCDIEFVHSTRSDLKYVNKQLTTMKRIGQFKTVNEDISLYIYFMFYLNIIAYMSCIKNIVTYNSCYI